ncbi:MAG: organomercurial lyase [Candidatus Dormibacteria bacterium]
MSQPASCSDVAFISSVEGFDAFPQIVRLIARGEPVDLDELAPLVQRSRAVVERSLRGQPGTEWDAEGNLVGFGLTLQPTEHRFTVAGRTLYTWCAADTLLFTLILGEPAVAESTCPTTQQAVRVELAPDGLLSVSPQGAVISQRCPGELVGDLRAEICDHGHFYATAAAAGGWAAEHPDGEVLSIADAYQRCRATCAELGWIPEVANR